MKRTLILLVILVLNLFAYADETSAQRDPFQKMTGAMLQAAADGTLSLEFNDIKVRDVLQQLAEYAHKNMVINDNVQGNISLSLNHVTWQQALDTIFLMQNLSARQAGNVLLVTTNPLATNSLAVTSALLSIRYAKAVDLAGLIKNQDSGLLSKNGFVSADPRTNSLWLQDTPEKVSTIRNFIARLDVPVKQVSIKARIVNVDDSCLKELGIKFGTVSTANSLLQDGLHMDMPEVVNQAGRFNLAVASLGANTLLDLELSALESEGHGKIISSPEVITADRTAAYIEAGEEVPYQERTGENVTSVAFKKAVLGLKVVPQITPQNHIVLNLTVNQDRISQLLFQGVPAIQTREIQTQVTVANGHTIVLGGIYEQSDNDAVERIPFLGSLPVVGGLFRNHATRAERKELLIFVTPQVVG